MAAPAASVPAAQLGSLVRASVAAVQMGEHRFAYISPILTCARHSSVVHDSERCFGALCVWLLRRNGAFFAPA